MKKIISLALALLLVCASFAGCSNTETGSSDVSGASTSSSAAEGDTATGGKYKIGILAPAVTHGWVAGVAYYADMRGKELADKGEIEYKLLTSDNAEGMTSQIDELKTWGAQAVVAFPQWEGMEDPIQALIDEGIPVVNFDIVIDADGVYHLAGDNKEMGSQSAQYIVDKIGTTGKVVMLNVPSAGSVSELRQAGFEEKIAEIAPDIQVVTYATKFTREDGLKDFTDILAANDTIDAVFSMDDETSIGVLQAIEESGRTDVKVVTGGGGMQEYFKMMAANQDIWIQSALYSPAMVADAVDMALAVLKGEDTASEKIIPTTIVDRDNCEEFLDENSPY